MEKPRIISRKTTGLQAGLGHNRRHIPPEDLQAELEALRIAEEKTEASRDVSPKLIDYIYEVRFFQGGSLSQGELEAFDLKHAERQLHVILGVTRLPVDTRIIEKHIADEERQIKDAARNRRLLRALTTHHHWLQGKKDGIRADLSNEDLSNVNFEGRDLSHVSLTNAKLSGAILCGAKLVGADLTGADLSGADLTGCDLTSASLSEANLIGANLSSTELKGADVWRANLTRCVISPENLHMLLSCQPPDNKNSKK
ncbi:MAG: pentapeptide repeat-containing protein [Sneathiella sp.]|nr:pentapeptide repeat-containing protein [Sneathiella sp.]